METSNEEINSDTGARRISDALSEEGEAPNTGLRHYIIRLFERQ